MSELLGAEPLSRSHPQRETRTTRLQSRVLLAVAMLGLIAHTGCEETKGSTPAVPASTAHASPIAGSDSLTDLERRVTALEKQVATQPSALPPASAGWSCAALCVTKYHCTANGDSNVTFHHVEATGETPLAAFTSLTSSCAKDDELEVHAQCKGGQIEETDATLSNACVKN